MQHSLGPSMIGTETRNRNQDKWTIGEVKSFSIVDFRGFGEDEQTSTFPVPMGGHLLVVIGGNKDYVYLADSSRLNMRAMDRKTFLKYWVGFAVVATPNS